MHYILVIPTAILFVVIATFKFFEWWVKRPNSNRSVKNDDIKARIVDLIADNTALRARNIELSTEAKKTRDEVLRSIQE